LIHGILYHPVSRAAVPIIYRMNWVPKTRRWKKMYLGTLYSVSCRQLGTPATKEGSWRAANGWWETQQREIDAGPVDEQAARTARIRAVIEGFGQLDDESRREVIDGVWGVGEFDALKADAKSRAAKSRAAAPDRSVGVQVDAWLSQLRAAVQSGRMSEGRYDAYSRKIRPFAGHVDSVDAIDEAALDSFYAALSESMRAGRYSASTAHETLMTAKQFVRWLAERKLIALPGNIDSRRFRFGHSAAKKIETFSPEEVQAMLAACGKGKVKLYLLLCLNCGMYQNDISELTQTEVDWKGGLVTRSRSKTRERDTPVTTYRLWPETFALLKQFRARKGDLVLTTTDGKPLVKEWLEGGAYRKYDSVRAAWLALAKKMGLTKNRLGLKHLRKTSATLLGEHPQYKFFSTYFLADSPKGMSEKHYTRPSDPEFFEALDWLRGRLLAEGPEPLP
jgi:integrase